MDAQKAIRGLLGDSHETQNTRFGILSADECDALSEAIEVMRFAEEMCAIYRRRFPGVAGAGE